MGDSSTSCNPPKLALLEELIWKVKYGCAEEKRDGAKELRWLAKLSSMNRICIAEVGAIPPLIKTLSSCDVHAQAHAIAALLNLTLRNEGNKQSIMTSGGLEPIVELLNEGCLQETRENAAALLFNLSCCCDLHIVKMMVGLLEDVFVGLVDILRNGSVRGKKDASAALFNLLQTRHSRALAVRAGAVLPLLQMVQDPSLGLVDETLTVLLSLASHQEGRYAILKASGIKILVDLLKIGSESNKEYACAVLLVLCLHDYGCSEEVCKLGAEELLVGLSISGTESVQRKVKRLVKLLK
ncbi:hypothetical protein GOP47_0004496 [Adiantum capillus-veneris]|uniref:U-box domain-containing protein n=1 Tax=Adiantum capillus-veneris TaxID=13818 RepID=A0A9D4V7Z9_ADICA|nr:hypothetical protein GOP47_0004496 [Adiantum capillus-veneris]